MTAAGGCFDYHLHLPPVWTTRWPPSLAAITMQCKLRDTLAEGSEVGCNAANNLSKRTLTLFFDTERVFFTSCRSCRSSTIGSSMDRITSAVHSSTGACEIVERWTAVDIGNGELAARNPIKMHVAGHDPHKPQSGLRKIWNLERDLDASFLR